MDRKSLIYSGVLLLSLVFVAFLLNRGLVQAVLTNGDVKLSTTSTPTQLGQMRHFTSTLDFPSLEEVSLFRVQFVIQQLTSSNTTTNTTTIDIDLPIDPVTSSVTTTIVVSSPYGNHTVTVMHVFDDVEPFDPSNSTLDGATFPATLPGATFPGAAYFKGVQIGAHISYKMWWEFPNNAYYVGDYTSTVFAFVADPAGSTLTNSSNQVSFQIAGAAGAVPASVPLRAGWNLIGVPYTFETVTTFKDMADQVTAQNGTVTRIQYWDSAAQGYVIWSGGATAEEFVAGSGYFIRVTAAPDNDEWAFKAFQITAPAAVDVRAGWNLVALPITQGLTMKTLAEAIESAGGFSAGTITRIQKWDAAAQGYDIWSGGPLNNNTAIESDAGYFIRSTDTTLGFTP